MSALDALSIAEIEVVLRRLYESVRLNHCAPSRGIQHPSPSRAIQHQTPLGLGQTVGAGVKPENCNRYHKDTQAPATRQEASQYSPHFCMMARRRSSMSDRA